MNKIKIAFRQEEVEATIRMIKRYNNFAKGWSDDHIRGRINAVLDYFLTEDIQCAGTMGFRVILAEEYESDGYTVKSLDIMVESSMIVSGLGMDSFTMSYRTND